MSTDEAGSASPGPAAEQVDGAGDVANAARVYDSFLGGAHNFAADRRLAERVAAQLPGAAALARANRRFLQRAVTHCQDLGIRQFLDLGSGIPTVGNVHEIARATDPGARVAYVDVEPVAVAHSRELLSTEPLVSITHADIRHPATVLAAAGVAELLDLDRPVALLAVAVLHFLPDDDDPAGILAAYRRHLAPGSVIVMSHVSDDYPEHPALAAEARRASAWFATSNTPTTLRDRGELAALLGGAELAAPGLVDVASWAQPAADTPLGGYAAITEPL